MYKKKKKKDHLTDFDIGGGLFILTFYMMFLVVP